MTVLDSCLMKGLRSQFADKVLTAQGEQELTAVNPCFYIHFRLRSFVMTTVIFQLISRTKTH